MGESTLLKRRLENLMLRAENQNCSDCNDKKPTWASLIVPPKGSPLPTIGAFCCMNCSGIHRGMGTHICFVRSIRLDEWKESEVLAMEVGGNKHVNSIFEGKASTDLIKPDSTSDLPTREIYIRSKYVERKYYCPEAYAAVGKRDTAEANQLGGVDRRSKLRRQASMPVFASPRATQTKDLATRINAIGRIHEDQSGFSPNWKAFASPEKVKSVTTKLGPRKDDMSVSWHDNSQRKRQDLSTSWHSQSASKRGMTTPGRIYQTGLNDEELSDKQKEKPSSEESKASSSAGSRPRSSRSRSRSTGRKPSDKLKTTSGHSTTRQTDDDSDGDSSFAADDVALEKDLKVAEKGQMSLKSLDAFHSSVGSMDSDDANVLKSSSRYRRGNRRMPRGGRGGLDRALSVPNMQQPRSSSQPRRKMEKRTNDRRENRNLKASTSEECNVIAKVVQAASDGTEESKKSSGKTDESRTRSSSRSRPSDQRRQRSTSRKRSSSRKRGIRRQASSDSIPSSRNRSYRSDTSGERSTSKERLRRRGTSKDNTGQDSMLFDDDNQRDRTFDEGSEKKRSERGGSSRGQSSRSKRSSPPRRRLNRSKSDDTETLSNHFSSSRISLSKSEHGDDCLSIDTSMKPKVTTQVTKKQVKADNWIEESEEFFSDEDLFANCGDPLFDETDDEEDEMKEAEESPVRKEKAKIPIKLVKDVAHAAKDPPRPSIDIEALTFYS